MSVVERDAVEMPRQFHLAVPVLQPLEPLLCCFLLLFLFVVVLFFGSLFSLQKRKNKERTIFQLLAPAVRRLWSLSQLLCAALLAYARHWAAMRDHGRLYTCSTCRRVCARTLCAEHRYSRAKIGPVAPKTALKRQHAQKH